MTPLPPSTSPEERGGSRELSRRTALSAIGALGAAAFLAACGSDANSATSSSTSASATGTGTGTAETAGATDTAATTASPSTAAATTSTAASTDTAAAATCAAIPEETAGPYPGNGSNGPNILTESGVVRSDIRSSIGSASGIAEGVPLTIEMTIVDTTDGCAPLAGAAVYLWHCDRDGQYSMYTGAAESQNYLRGVQVAGADGTLTFTSIFPAAYSGRWPHIHFEVYSSVDDATSGGNVLATSQIALPEEVCDLVFATDGYGQSVSNMDRTSLASDNVFGEDEGEQQLATCTGSVEAGIMANLTVGV